MTHCRLCGHKLKGDFPHVTGARRRRVIQIIADNPGINSHGILAKLYVHIPRHQRPNGYNLICQLVRLARPQIALDGFRIDGSKGHGGGWMIRAVK